MTALQFAIGALNDVVDAPRDSDRLVPKPIPAGLVSRQAAVAVMGVTALVGVALAVPSGLALAGLAVVVLGIGAAYDLVAKGTPWSWLPFAVGIPILPVYGWFGAAGTLPGFFGVLVPMAVLAGAALAIANARADLETDLAAGTRSVATVLGARRAVWVGAVLMLTATAIGYLYAQPPATSTFSSGVVMGTLFVIIGLGQGNRTEPDAWRLGWGLQAVGAGIAGIGWVGTFLNAVGG